MAGCGAARGRRRPSRGPGGAVRAGRTVATRAGANSEERTRSAGAAVSASPTGAVLGRGLRCVAGRGAAEPCFIPATMA